MSDKTTKLGDICDFVYGDGLPEAKRKDGEIPVYGSNGIVGWHDQAITTGRTIIVGRKGSIGQVHLSEVPCWPIDTTYYIDSTKRRCDLDWLYYMLLALDLPKLDKSAAIPGLNRNDAYEKVIPDLPLPEQQRIAGILAKADRLRRLRRYALELSDTYLQSVFLEMFGDGDGSEQVKIQDLMRRKVILEMKDGNHGESYPRHSDFVLQGIPFLTAKNVINGQVFLKTAPCISKEKAGQLRIGWVKPEDVLLSHNATVGRVAIVPQFEGRLVIGTSLTFYRLNHDVLTPAYFAQVLRSQSFQAQMEQVMKQTTRNQVPITRQRELTVPEPPPLLLQRRFAQVVRGFEHLRAQQREAQRQAEHLFQTLLHQAFEGEV